MQGLKPQDLETEGLQRQQDDGPPVHRRLFENEEPGSGLSGPHKRKSANTTLSADTTLGATSTLSADAILNASTPVHQTSMSAKLYQTGGTDLAMCRFPDYLA